MLCAFISYYHYFYFLLLLFLNLGEESYLNFYGCSEGQDATGKSLDLDDWCFEFRAKTHPVFLIISIVFLIITLFVYLAEDSLRCHKKKMFLKTYYGIRGSNVLFSRITMGFVINLTIALILFTVEAMKSQKYEDDDRKTGRCIAKAYLTLYFFLVSILGN